MNDRLPETILIRMSNRTLNGATLERVNIKGIPIYQLQDYDNSSTQQQKPEGDVKNHPSDGTPSDKA